MLLHIFKLTNTCIKHTMKQIAFGDYSVTTCNFFVITIQYVNVVLTATVCIYTTHKCKERICNFKINRDHSNEK